MKARPKVGEAVTSGVTVVEGLLEMGELMSRLTAEAEAERHAGIESMDADGPEDPPAQEVPEAPPDSP